MATSGTSLNQVPHLWFEDGNIIITAGDKAFRLYKGVIASRSSVFRDMFNIPQFSAPVGAGDYAETCSKSLPRAPPAPWAQDGADRIATDGGQQDYSAPWAPDGADRITTDGGQQAYSSLGVTRCPVVRLPDKPKEVEWLLSAFFHSHMEQYSGNTSALAGILRLATKYEVSFLRKWSLECLERLYPFATNVDGDNLLQIQQILETRGRGREWMNGMFPLIDVAMTVGVSWVLPQVLWELQNVRLTHILHHPEWPEFPEERKTKFLLGHDYRNEANFGWFERVLGLYGTGTVHGPTPAGTKCMDTFQRTLRHEIGKKGRGTAHDALWRKYANQLGCAECKQRYAAMWRADLIDLFLIAQHRNGLPAPAEMKELRDKYYQQGFMHE